MYPNASQSNPRDKLQSQKARGIHDLLNMNVNTPATIFVPPSAKPAQIIAGIARVGNATPETKMFVRPCPESPNHGGNVAGFQSECVTYANLFAHIRKVQSAINRQKLKADIIVMPYIEAKLSAVAATGKYIIWGKGHNGVTAGTSATIALPLDESSGFVNRLISKGYNPDEVEIEFVCDRIGAQTIQHCVQIRKASSHIALGAPPDGAFAGFVPSGKMKVKQFYYVDGLDDLGGLELLKHEDHEGLLVVQTVGNMLSHAAAHCRGSGIAFVIADRDNFLLDEVITEASPGWVVQGDQEPNAYSPEKYFDYFLAGLHLPLKGNGDTKDSNMMLGVFMHQYSSNPMNDPRLTATLAGMFARWLLHFGTAAFVGECRHLDMVKSGLTWKARVELQKMYADVFGSSKPSRNAVLRPLVEQQATLDQLYNTIKWTRREFELQWGGAFGGKAWHNCATAAWFAIECIRSKDCAQAIHWLNELERGVHNTGRLYNKFPQSLPWLEISTSGFSIDRGEYNSLGMSTSVANLVIPAVEDFEEKIVKRISELVNEPVSEGGQAWQAVSKLSPEIFDKKELPESPPDDEELIVKEVEELLEQSEPEDDYKKNQPNLKVRAKLSSQPASQPASQPESASESQPEKEQ